jgi:hypothetical protein
LDRFYKTLQIENASHISRYWKEANPEKADVGGSIPVSGHHLESIAYQSWLYSMICGITRTVVAAKKGWRRALAP